MASNVRTPKTEPLTDRQLANRGKRWVQLREQIAALTEEVAVLGDEILTELDRRQIENVEVCNVLFRKRFSTIRTRDIAALKEHATQGLYSRVTKVVIDTNAWNLALKSGVLPPDVLAKVETEKSTAPWPDIKILA